MVANLFISAILENILYFFVFISVFSQFDSSDSIPEKITFDCIKDKFGQRYAGIYVGDCEVSDDAVSRRYTLTASGDTSRRTSQSCLGNCYYIHHHTLILCHINKKKQNLNIHLHLHFFFMFYR